MKRTNMKPKTASTLGALVGIVIALILVYLFFVALAYGLIYAFSLSYSPWVLGIGIWIIVFLGRTIFKGR